MESHKLDSMILAADGSLANRTMTALTVEDAELLRMYRKFLERYHLIEALYCAECWDKSRDDGCRAFVTGERILIECRCTVRTFQGSTY
jgi:hypothetical protein